MLLVKLFTFLWRVLSTPFTSAQPQTPTYSGVLPTSSATVQPPVVTPSPTPSQLPVANATQVTLSSPSNSSSAPFSRDFLLSEAARALSAVSCERVEHHLGVLDRRLGRLSTCGHARTTSRCGTCAALILGISDENSATTSFDVEPGAQLPEDLGQFIKAGISVIEDATVDWQEYRSWQVTVSSPAKGAVYFQHVIRIEVKPPVVGAPQSLGEVMKALQEAFPQRGQLLCDAIRLRASFDDAPNWNPQKLVVERTYQVTREGSLPSTLGQAVACALNQVESRRHLGRRLQWGADLGLVTGGSSGWITAHARLSTSGSA